MTITESIQCHTVVTGGRSDQCSVKAWVNKKVLSLDLKNRERITDQSHLRHRVITRQCLYWQIKELQTALIWVEYILLTATDCTDWLTVVSFTGVTQLNPLNIDHIIQHNVSDLSAFIKIHLINVVTLLSCLMLLRNSASLIRTYNINMQAKTSQKQ